MNQNFLAGATGPPDNAGASQAPASDARPIRDIEEELLILLWLYKNKFRQAFENFSPAVSYRKVLYLSSCFDLVSLAFSRIMSRFSLNF